MLPFDLPSPLNISVAVSVPVNSGRTGAHQVTGHEAADSVNWMFWLTCTDNQINASACVRVWVYVCVRVRERGGEGKRFPRKQSETDTEMEWEGKRMTTRVNECDDDSHIKFMLTGRSWQKKSRQRCMCSNNDRNTRDKQRGVFPGIYLLWTLTYLGRAAHTEVCLRVADRREERGPCEWRSLLRELQENCLSCVWWKAGQCTRSQHTHTHTQRMHAHTRTSRAAGLAKCEWCTVSAD